MKKIQTWKLNCGACCSWAFSRSRVVGTKLFHYFTHNCNVSSSEGSLLPLWKFRYVEGDEEEEEADALGRKEPLEITSLRFPNKIV